MRKIRLLTLVLAAALAGGCGGDSDSNDRTPNGNPDAGTQPDPNTQTGGLAVTMPFGISLIDVPEIGAHPVDGYIIVQRDGEDVTTAKVTVNGVEVPVAADWYPVSNVTVPDAEAGKPLKIVAEDGSDKVELTLNCPTEVQFTAPADGTTVAAGQKVTFSWSGKLGPYSWGLLDEPYLSLLGNEPSEAGDHPFSLGFPKDGENHASLSATDTSAELTMPETDKPAYLAKLHVPGDQAKSGESSGYCKLVRTLHLTKQ
jgi:hypothetical protein